MHCCMSTQGRDRTRRSSRIFSQNFLKLKGARLPVKLTRCRPSRFINPFLKIAPRMLIFFAANCVRPELPAPVTEKEVVVTINPTTTSVFSVRYEQNLHFAGRDEFLRK